MERSCEPMSKNRIEGVTEQGERARNREALVTKARLRRSGGCGRDEASCPRQDTENIGSVLLQAALTRENLPQ